VGSAPVFEALRAALLASRGHSSRRHTDIIANQKYIGEMEGRLQIYLRELGRAAPPVVHPELGALRTNGLARAEADRRAASPAAHFEAGELRVVGTLTPSAWETLQQSVPGARAVRSHHGRAHGHARQPEPGARLPGRKREPDDPKPADDRVIRKPCSWPPVPQRPRVPGKTSCSCWTGPGAAWPMPDRGRRSTAPT